MLLEQILRVIGLYKNICDEHEYMDIIFKQAKTGNIQTLFSNKEAENNVFEVLEHISGISRKYWSGQERIKLGIRSKNKELIEDMESIDTVDLSKDERYISEEGEGHAYHGILYQEQLKNPLHLDYDKIYSKVSKTESVESENKNKNEIENKTEYKFEEAVKVIESLYSLRGILTVVLLNMSEIGEIEIIDKANVYKHKSWEAYIRILKEPTQHSITYSPRFIEIRKGIVQTIIKNIYGMGIIVPFRDLDKEFII